MIAAYRKTGDDKIRHGQIFGPFDSWRQAEDFRDACNEVEGADWCIEHVCLPILANVTECQCDY
jgi:hypothetical protein